MIEFLNLPILINHYLILSSLIFLLGVIGILMSIELILLGVNINFIAFSYFSSDLTGQIFSLFILTVAAAEAAIGLAILVVYFRNKGTIDVKDINVLKG